MLGQRLRDLRHERRLSLKQLAELTGVSIALLSQVERSHIDPSLDTLRRIAKALDIPLFSLFAQPTDNVVAVVPKDRRPHLIAAPGAVAYTRVSPGFGRLEVLEGVLEPGAASSPSLWAHNSEECALVLQGTLTVEFENEIHTLHVGDSIYFDSHQGHRYVNATQEPVIYLVSVTPPSF